MDFTETREAIAEALNTLDGLSIRERKVVKTPKAGDGWVTLGPIRPGSTYTACTATFTVIITLGSDGEAADSLYETLALDIVDAVTTADELNVADVVLEPITLVTEGGASIGALTLTLTAEVEM